MLQVALERVTITRDNCIDVLAAITARDQRREVRVGDVISHEWEDHFDGEKDEITIWHNRRRAAVCRDGGDSEWGDWDEQRQVIVPDESGSDGRQVLLDRHGERLA